MGVCYGKVFFAMFWTVSNFLIYYFGTLPQSKKEIRESFLNETLNQLLNGHIINYCI